jgi:uncharacterized protein involved in outer membrane biogenesis
LHSQLLRLIDIGPRASGLKPEAGAAPALLLSDARFNPQAVRHGDARVHFQARRVDIGRVALQSVAATLTIDHGLVVIDPLSGDVLEGKFTANANIDATSDNPEAQFDLKMVNLQADRLAGKGKTPAPPVEGMLRVRVVAKGHGNSLHQVAASADGSVTAVLTHGTIRASLAELTGIDLRGLGLLLVKDHQETAVDCGVLSFRAQGGTLASQSMVVDTDSVLITGEGTIHLETEALDLALRGHPKHLRLVRVRSPLTVHGTLAHPSVGIQVRNSVAQTAEAVALGVLLTPLASVLAFVDPGLAKDADCASLLAAAKALDKGVPSSPPAH